ncbi:hypothetical protein [Pseudonocardia acaciae]|uniref:hypothetical protein n=1 Tax=Pseudonocardia acaciae TaxID=551276 RepID=UPI0012EDEC8A|nr:hypothetical protein [Pseudonocardia acaciae]
MAEPTKKHAVSACGDEAFRPGTWLPGRVVFCRWCLMIANDADHDAEPRPAAVKRRRAVPPEPGFEEDEFLRLFRLFMAWRQDRRMRRALELERRRG